MDLLLELLLELLRELLLVPLLLLLLYVPYHVHLGGREAPPLDLIHSKVLIPGLGRIARPRSSVGLRFAPSSALLRSTG